MKKVRVGKAAKKTLKTFPVGVVKDLRYLLMRLELGHKLTMPLSRSMHIVSLGVNELRLKDRSGIYRVFYYLKLREEILIFHAFQKKTQETPDQELVTARARLNQLLLEENE